MGKGGKGDKKEKKGAAKVGLVEKNGALTERFRLILGEIFKTFDKDQDGGLNRSELEAFAKASGTGQIDADEMKQLGQYFDTDKHGSLTKKGFEQMYLMQTNHQASDTWRDLEKLGYTKELELKQAVGEEDLTKMRMDEMRAALMELKDAPGSAFAHQRVGRALQALGREEAAQKEFKAADEIELKAAKETSTVEDID